MLKGWIGEELELRLLIIKAKFVPGRTQWDNIRSLASANISFSKVLSETASFSYKYLSHDFDELGCRQKQFAHFEASVVQSKSCVVSQRSQIAGRPLDCRLQFRPTWLKN